MLYVDTSALLERYIHEHDSVVAAEHMASDEVLVTSHLTQVEVRRNLTRLLDGDALLAARAAFAIDLDSFALVLLDATVMSNAAQIAEATLCRSLDACTLPRRRGLGRTSRCSRSTLAKRTSPDSSTSPRSAHEHRPMSEVT
jgi:predicted nucleic acid-binding protein